MNLESQRLMPLPIITLAFLLLVVALESLLAGYWLLAIEPRLEQEAESNSILIAQSQAAILSNAVETSDGHANRAKVIQAVDTLLLSRDPVMQVPYFVKIELEVDYDTLQFGFSSGQQTLNVVHSAAACATCFIVPIELYSDVSDEIIGIATFTINSAFFQALKRDVKHIMVVLGITVFGLLGVAWAGAIIVARALNQQIKARLQAQQLMVQAKEEAETANRAKSDFLANMSHEIRTPMNAITGLCYLVLKTRLTKHQRSYMEKLHSSANLLLKIINDILDFSKIEAGRLQLESVAFKLDDVLNKLAQMVMADAGQKGLDILYRVDRDVPQQLKGDPLRLGQVLLNLVNNSIKFTTQGEVSISVRTLARTEQSVILEFAVKDTGMGIEPNRIADLFSPFTQADTSTSRQFGGSGLGLAICVNLVKSMNGNIQCQSVPGSGTTMTFTVTMAPLTIEENYVLPQKLKKHPALVVDDSQSSREVFADMLSRFDFDVAMAESGEQAIALIKKANKANKANYYRLVLLDWKMPGLNGVQTAKIMKEMTSHDQHPIIILTTAYGFDESIEKDAHYLDSILIKPVSHSALYDTIMEQFAENPQRSVEPRRHGIDQKNIQQYPGVRVLLAEDNKINQEVALSLLSEAGLETDVANNGLQAVKLCQAHHYALILMDIQMPEIDGYEATKRIRALNANANRKVPIIAMTAHAMQGDHQKCVAAGMDDYLTKPVDVKRFHKTLERWLDSTGAKVDVSVTDNVSLPISLAGLDGIADIDVVAALSRLNQNQQLFCRLLRSFASDNRNTITRLQAFSEEKNTDGVKALLHRLKGEAGNLGLIKIHEAIVTLESAIRVAEMPLNSEEFKDLTQGLSIVDDAIHRQFDGLENAHNQKISENESPDSDSHNPELASKQLVELRTMLADHNLKACDIGEKLRQSFHHPDGDEILNQLLTCLHNLDFKGAEALAGELSLTIKTSNHQ